MSVNDPSLLLLELPFERRKLLCLDRPMQTQLHRNLHHQSAKHKSSIGPLTRCGQRPGAK